MIQVLHSSVCTTFIHFCLVLSFKLCCSQDQVAGRENGYQSTPHYGVTKLALILMTKTKTLLLWGISSSLSITSHDLYGQFIIILNINFIVRLTLLCLYLLSRKLRHRGVSNGPGADIALHLPFVSPECLFDLHFPMIVNKREILPGFMYPKSLIAETDHKRVNCSYRKC